MPTKNAIVVPVKLFPLDEAGFDEFLAEVDRARRRGERTACAGLSADAAAHDYSVLISRHCPWRRHQAASQPSGAIKP